MLTVLYTANDGYLPYLGISLVSLLQNNPEEQVRVYAVLSEAKKDNLDKLNSIRTRYSNLDLRIIDGAPYIARMKKLKMIQYRQTFVPNLRLFFTEYIDRDVDRLLYLDSDTLVVGSLHELFAMDMGGNCVGVVLDSLTGAYKHRLGYREEEPYFNSGVLLIDVAQWNRCHCTEELFRMIERGDNIHANPDQDCLNLLLHEKIQVLPPEFNLQPHHMCLPDSTYFSCYARRGYYTEQQLRHAVENPVIIHAYRFLGDFCWHEENLHPASMDYEKYKELSPWREQPQQPAKKNLTFRLEKLAYRCLPTKWYFKMWCWMQQRYFAQQDNKNRRKIHEMV